MWVIVIEDSRGQEKARCELCEGEVSLGRAPGCELRVNHPAISRRHASFAVVDGCLWVEDLGSSNGVFVDGVPIGQRISLAPSQRVAVADLRVRIRNQGAPAAPATRPADFTLIPMAEPQGSPAGPPQRRESPHAPQPADSLLDHKINSIRSHRDAVQSEAAQRQQAFETAWTQTLDELRRLKARLRGDQRIGYFTFSRDTREVAVKFKLSPGDLRSPLLMFSRGHPERRVGGDERIWVRDLDQNESHYADPAEALSEFLTLVAARLA